jgi:hypothetical protein
MLSFEAILAAHLRIKRSLGSDFWQLGMMVHLLLKIVLIRLAALLDRVHGHLSL